jgi:hypothetical protein
MAKMALMEDDPPDGYEEDIPPDGYEDNAKPDMVQPKATPKAPSNALDAYNKGLDAYIAGDRENAARMASEALRLDPTMVEAQRMLERFKVSPNAGTTPVDFPTSLPVHKIENRFSSIAPLATKIVQSATPPSNIRKIIRSPLDVPLETAKRAVRVGEAIDKSPVTKTVGAGNARLLAQAARVPNLAANIFALPYNAAVQVAGRGDLAQASPRLFEKEATWWDEKAAQLSEGNKRWGEKGEDFLTVVKRRNPKEISQYIAYKVLEEAPQQAIVIGTTLAGMPTSALAYMGVSSAAQSQAEGEGRTNPAAVTANAVINGTLEAALERTPALLGKWSKALEGSFGNKGKLEILKNVAKTITSSMIQEGPVEEGSTEFLQSLAKMATGVDPNAMRGVGGRMIEASTIGAAMGGGMTAPAAIGAGIARSMDSQAQNGQPVAPLDTNGIPAYPSLHGQPTVGTDVTGGGVSPGSVTPAIQPGSDDVGPPDGFVDDVGGHGQQVLQPQGQTNPTTVVTEQVPPDSPGMDVAPTPDVPDVGQVTPPQGEQTPTPVTHPKTSKKQIQKPVKQFTPIDGLTAIIPKRTTLPILKGFNVTNGVATATDLTTYLETNVDLPDGHYKMVGKNAEKTNEKQDNFPNRPEDGTKIGTVDRSDMIRNFERVNKATSDDATRYVLNGVNLSVTNGKASLVATDGRRLSMSPLDTAKLSDGSYIIPNANGFEKALKALADGPLDVAIITDKASKTESMISFSSKNGRVVSRLVDGNFPKFDQVIPEPNEQIVFSKDVLANALKEIAPYVKESGYPSVLINRDGDNYSVIVPKTDKTNGKTIIIKGKAVNGKFGKINVGSVVMPMDVRENLAKTDFILGPGFLGALDIGYLRNAVESISGKDVYLGRTEDAFDPVVIRGTPLDPKAKMPKKDKPKRGRGPGKKGQASTGGQSIEEFESSPEGPTSQSRRIESFETLTTKEQTQEFKLFDQVHDLVKKYAGLVGERYLPRQTSGVYYTETKNIRLKSLNELSVAVHEITHAIDAKVVLSDNLNRTREWDVVGGLTEVYTEMYPTGKKDHPVKKRIVEGLATLIQKTAEMPTAMEYKYGDLVKMFTKPGGKHYVKELDMLLQDTKKIVSQFQKLDSLQKVGAFTTENFQQKEARDSFLGVMDQFRTTTMDAVWPLEKAAKMGGIERTSQDPSLWARAYQGTSGIVLANMAGKKGFWIPNAQGGFTQISDKNLGDMVDGLKKRGMLERFGWWLLARDTAMDYKKLDELEDKAIEATNRIAEAQRTIAEMGPGGVIMSGGKSLKQQMQEWKKDIERFTEKKGVLGREPLSRDVWESAHEQNKADFKEDSKLFDVFTKANVDLLQMSGLITPEQVAELREGYAPKKRDIYDDILGAERAQMPAVMVGKNKVSSMMARKGSSLTYLNPVYSVIKDHAEIVKKSLRQMVYNKIRDLKTVLPGVIHELELNVIVDKDTGRISFPQEKDPNIVMARDVDGGRHPLLVGKDLKNVIDDILQFHQMNVFERVVRYSAQMFSQLTTSTYPPFVLTNLAMDIPTAIANTRTKMVPVYDAIRELSKALMDKTSKEHEYAQEWFASHGERQSLAGWQTLDPEDFYRLLVNEKHWLIRATKKAVGAVDVLSIPGKYSEIMSRLTEYIRSRKAGKPWIVAMEDSARVTTPFSHMGRWGSGTWGKTLIRSIAFMNPGIQALDQFTRTAGNKGTRARLLFVMAATIAASTGGLAWIMKQGSNEQKDRYKDLEGKMITNYVWFPSPDGKSLIKVRVAEQYGWLAALTNLAIGETIFNTDYKFRDYVDGATSWVPDQFDITNPVMALMSWIPQVVKSPVEVAFDKRTFPNLRPLTPMSVKHLPPGERTIETTSTFAKKIGKFLDLSPIAIDHIIEGYLGRTARFATGRIFNMKLNPFAQDWYFTSGRNIQDFYETRERAKYLEQSFRTGERNLTKSELSELRHNVPRIQEIEKRLSIIRKYDKAGKSLKGDELYKNRKEILTLIGELK